MSKSYVIQWKSMENGRTGTGTKLFDLSEAESLAEELNREYPDIQHEVAAADLSAEPLSTTTEPGPADLPEAETENPQRTHSRFHAFSLQ